MQQQTEAEFVYSKRPIVAIAEPVDVYTAVLKIRVADRLLRELEKRGVVFTRTETGLRPSGEITEDERRRLKQVRGEVCEILRRRATHGS